MAHSPPPMRTSLRTVTTSAAAKATEMVPQLLRAYHPVIVEGMGYYDPRDPAAVARQITGQLQSHWASGAAPEEDGRPRLLVTQGDPLTERGISAITPLVADGLGIKRGLVTLDECIDPDHSRTAPRDGVVVEVAYSDLLAVLGGEAATALERGVEGAIESKNELRRSEGKAPLRPYYKDYAMLQEVTKAACLELAGDVTVVHTAATISEYSVTSFYEVGLELGLLLPKHYVPYGIEEDVLAGGLNRLDSS